MERIDIINRYSFLTPFFIIDYPKESGGFYEREDPESPGIPRDFDMLYPEGFGEAASGAEREYDRVVRRMLERKRRVPRSMGGTRICLRREYRRVPALVWGLRGAQGMCGLPAVWEARPYPKVPGIVPTP